MFSSDAIQSGRINTSGIIFLTTNIKLKAKIIRRRQELSDPSHPLAYATERIPKRYLFPFRLLRDKYTFQLPPVTYWIKSSLCCSSGSFPRFPKG